MSDAAVARLVALRWDANDPARLAGFWAAALRWTVDENLDGGVVLVPTDGTEFEIRFMAVAEPKAGKNRIHLDLTTASLEDQRDSVASLVELGAAHIDVGQGPDADHVVLADPDGNEFCVIEPQNSFLAGRGRLGSITCDGSPRVGRFWSEVLGWPLVWDQDGETAIRPPARGGPFITWGPPVPTPTDRSRLHLDIAAAETDRQTEVVRLISLGAVRLDASGDDVLMTDPDGNEFYVVPT